jgi:HAMP domain-containing protein
MAKNEKKEKQNKVAWYRSLQTKILVTLLLVTTIILGGFAVYNLTQAQDRLESELQRLAETTVQRLSQQVIGPMWSLNDDQLSESIEAAMLERRVYGVVIRKEDRESVYMARRRDDNWNIVDAKSIPEGDYVVSKTTLLHDNQEVIGVLEVYVSRRFLQERFNGLVANELRRGGILSLALIVVTLVLLRYLLVRPIHQLTNASERISAGQLDTKINVQSRDEIGMLAGGINKLQTSLRIAMERMKKAG